MSDTTRGTLLHIPLIEEKYGHAFVISLFLHVLLALIFALAPLLFPKPTPILLGTGPGGGRGEQYTVGVADELGGGEGMIKPSLIPQPPPLPVEEPVKEEIKEEAVPLPQTVEAKKPPPKAQEKAAKLAPKKIAEKASNVIPTAPQPGAGGSGGTSGGGGGGMGGAGSGVTIGAGSGGLGNSWYARAVESRIGSNWVKPQVAGRVEITYSFVITDSGQIRDIRKEKSCGNEMLDLTAERAIRASNPLPPLPPDLRGRPVQFMAQFIYPP